MFLIILLLQLNSFQSNPYLLTTHLPNLHKHQKQDVPDIKGDKLNNIKSFSVRAGAPRIFKVRACRGPLQAAMDESAD